MCANAYPALCRCSLMVEHQPSKLGVPVQFRSAAPAEETVLNSLIVWGTAHRLTIRVRATLEYSWSSGSSQRNRNAGIIQGRSQAVRHGTLTPRIAGSSPAVPAIPRITMVLVPRWITEKLRGRLATQRGHLYTICTNECRIITAKHFCHLAKVNKRERG